MVWRSYSAGFEARTLGLRVVVTLHDVTLKRVLAESSPMVAAALDETIVPSRYPDVAGHRNYLLAATGCPPSVTLSDGGSGPSEAWQFGVVHLLEWAQILVDEPLGENGPSDTTNKSLTRRFRNAPTEAGPARRMAAERMLLSRLVPLDFGSAPAPLINCLDSSWRVNEISIHSSESGLLGTLAMPGRCVTVSTLRLLRPEGESPEASDLGSSAS